MPLVNPLSERSVQFPRLASRAVPRVLTAPVGSQSRSTARRRVCVSRPLSAAGDHAPEAGTDIAPQCLRNGAAHHPAPRPVFRVRPSGRVSTTPACRPRISLWQAGAQARRGRSGRGRLSEKSARFRPGSPGPPTPPPPQRGQGGGPRYMCRTPCARGRSIWGWATRAVGLPNYTGKTYG